MTASGQLGRTVGRSARRWSPGNRSAQIGALLRRDLAEHPIFRLSLLLDLAFAAVNLAVFLLISRLLPTAHPVRLGHAPSYFDYVAVGITFMLVIQAATAQLTSRVVREQHGGTLEMLMTQPISVPRLAAGFAAYPFLFAMVRAVAYLAILGPLLGLRVGRADWLGVAAVLVAGAAVMAGIGIVLVAVAILVGHGELAGRVVIVALSFLSGTYFPVETLHPALRPLVAVLPSRVALDGLRAALGGGSWTGDALILLGDAILLLPIALWTFDQALRLAAKRGVLTRG